MKFIPPHLLDSDRWKNLRVGLLGGSFNPPHEGHVHISLIAQQTLKLDAVWWLVTPQNPLKNNHELLSYDERLEKCKTLTRNTDLVVTDIERKLNENRSYETIKVLKLNFPKTAFIWITGMDNALQFHKWYRWQDLLNLVPTAHIARPPAWGLIESCPLKLLKTQNHHYMNKAQKVSLKSKNTYWMMQKRMLNISSTKIRNSQIYTND